MVNNSCCLLSTILILLCRSDTWNDLFLNSGELFDPPFPPLVDQRLERLSQSDHFTPPCANSSFEQHLTNGLGGDAISTSHDALGSTVPIAAVPDPPQLPDFSQGNSLALDYHTESSISIQAGGFDSFDQHGAGLRYVERHYTIIPVALSHILPKPQP
jgi:hypothetical protein